MVASPSKPSYLLTKYFALRPAHIMPSTSKPATAFISCTPLLRRGQNHAQDRFLPSLASLRRSFQPPDRLWRPGCPARISSALLHRYLDDIAKNVRRASLQSHPVPEEQLHARRSLYLPCRTYLDFNYRSGPGTSCSAPQPLSSPWLLGSTKSLLSSR